MTAPWKAYACVAPSKGLTGTCTVLRSVHHVTHTTAALRILDDGKITRSLIYDESVLNDTRTTVVWLSPNRWYWGSRYGNVQFTFDFSDIVSGRKIYWVEAQTKYSPHAYRFIISDQSLKHLPVTAYDATSEEGPLRFAEGLWYWNATCTAEFLMDASLPLHQCRDVDFIKHHDQYCALGGGCGEIGSDGSRAAGRVMAYVLSRGLAVIDQPLIESEKKALSGAAEQGLSYLCFGLGAVSGKLSGPLKADVDVDFALRAALLQFAIGEVKSAKETVKLIGSDGLLRDRLAVLVQDHFKLKSDVLTA